MNARAAPAEHDGRKPTLVDDPAPVTRELNEGVLRLTIANPPANALSEAVLAGLAEHLADAVDDDAVRVIVITALGPVFSAGHDLKETTAHRADADGGREYYQTLLRQCSVVMRSIVRHPKPVIAEVGGLATAAGCQLVASCDLALASDKATFCTPGVHIGLFCSTPMVAVSRTVHRKHAMEMLLTGEAIDAATAREIGLINRVVPEEYLRKLTDEYAKRIASKSAATLKTGKEAFYRQVEMGLAEAYDYTVDVMSENMMAEDAKEGIGAFLEHRDPVWRDE